MLGHSLPIKLLLAGLKRLPTAPAKSRSTRKKRSAPGTLDLLGLRCCLHCCASGRFLLHSATLLAAPCCRLKRSLTIDAVFHHEPPPCSLLQRFPLSIGKH